MSAQDRATIDSATQEAQEARHQSLVAVEEAQRARDDANRAAAEATAAGERADRIFRQGQNK